MTLHSWGVQNSVIVPYNMLIWLKKSTANNEESAGSAWVSAMRHVIRGARTVDREPLINVLALRQPHREPQVTRPERRLCILFQLVLPRVVLANVLVRLERLVLVAGWAGGKGTQRQATHATWRERAYKPRKLILGVRRRREYNRYAGARR